MIVREVVAGSVLVAGLGVAGMFSAGTASADWGIGGSINGETTQFGDVRRIVKPGQRALPSTPQDSIPPPPVLMAKAPATWHGPPGVVNRESSMGTTTSPYRNSTAIRESPTATATWRGRWPMAEFTSSARTAVSLELRHAAEE